MRYAHNVARGYDDRAATTRALMCLPAGMMELVRPESMRPQTSQRSVLGADTSAATRGVRERRQDGGETTSKTPQLPRGASVAFGTEGVLLERSCRAFLAIARALATAVASSFAKSGGASSAAPFYRCPYRFSSRFLAVRAAQRNTRRHGAYTAPRDHSSARLRDGCAQNKSGYLRIRATDHKKRSDAVTNGQG